MKDETLKKIREAAAKVLQDGKEWWERPDETGKSPKDRLAEEIRRRFEDLAQEMTPEGMKIALAYREETRTSLAFEDLLSYIKANYRLTPGVRVCVLKLDGDLVQLDVMVCDADNNVSFGPMSPWTHFIVRDLGPRLRSMFGDKSMLVLK